MPKGFSDHEKELIRNKLLEQGRKQFSAYGLKKTNIDEIAGAAGISKGAFYLFYESKEAFFMDVVERVEEQFRREVLAEIDLPGESPRARLFAVLKKAFTLRKTIPIFRIFTHSDYEILARRILADKLEEHIHNDQIFLEELISRCRQAGMLIQTPLDQVSKLMYAIFFASLHEDDFGEGGFNGTINLLIELAAAFFLGEVQIQFQDWVDLPKKHKQGG